MRWCYTILVAFFLMSTSAFAQTIEELFLEIPGEKLGMKAGLSKDEKLKDVDFKDIKNGFLSLKSRPMELAKFSLPSESPILAVSDTSYADGRSMPKTLTFFQKSVDGWNDVTTRYLPIIPDLVIDAFSRQKCGIEISNSSSGTYRYHLPKVGQTISAVAESDALSGKKCKGDLFRLEFAEKKVGTQKKAHLQLKFVP